MEFFDTTITEKAKEYAMDVLNSGYLSEGDWVKEFENVLAEKFDYTYGVAVNSGTSALHLALTLAGIGQGDEVILPAQTFVATGLAILYCGGTPVFADIEMDGNISIDSVSKKITNKTKAVIAVAWGGLSPDLEGLHKICRDLHIKLIVDNAHALGAKVQYEDYSCFSFQAIKQLTTGDGGLLVCKSHRHYVDVKQMRWFGIDKEWDAPDSTGERYYNLHRLGYKYHMNNLAAAIGLGNLDYFDYRQVWVDSIAEYYDEYLPDYRTYRKESTNWLYTIIVEKRNDFIRAMKDRGVPTSVVHVGIDRNDIFGGKQDLPMQRYWDGHHVCLPIHSKLEFDDVVKVVDSVKAGW